MLKKATRITILVCMIAGISVATVFGATSKSPFSKSGYSSYIVPTKLQNHVIVNGVDVSVFQSRKGKDEISNVNWAKLKSNGVDYAILRVGGTYAASLKYYTDVTYKDHYAKAKKAGMMTGAYWLSQATTEAKAKEEAKKAVALLKQYGVQPKDLEFPIYMDYEFVSGGKMTSKNLTKAKATAAAKAFCSTIESYGYQSGIYASTSFFDKYIDASKLSSSCRLWIAQYYNKCQYTAHSFDMWQYSSSGTLSGLFIDSNNKSIDCDFWYLDSNRKGSGSSDIANCKINYDKYVTYSADGRLHKPSVSISDANGNKLKSGTDYTLSYIRNTKKGTAYVYIRGIGKFKGYKALPYTIASDRLSRYDMNECADAISFAEDSEYKLTDNKYIEGVALGTSAKDFLSKISVATGFTVELKTSSYKTHTGTVGTGCYLFVYNDGILTGVAQIVVDGDISGNGRCDETDVDLAAKCVVGLASLNSAQKKAFGESTVSMSSVAALIRRVTGRDVEEATAVEEVIDNSADNAVTVDGSENAANNNDSAAASGTDKSQEQNDNAGQDSANNGQVESGSSQQSDGAKLDENSNSEGDSSQSNDLQSGTSQKNNSEDNNLQSGTAQNNGSNEAQPVAQADEKVEEAAEVVKEPVILPTSISLTKSRLYRGENLYATVNVKANGEPMVVMLNVGFGKGYNYIAKYSGKGYYNKGKLILYSLDGKDMSFKFRLRSNTTGTQRISTSGSGLLVDETPSQCKSASASPYFSSAKAPYIRKVSKGKRYFRVYWKKRDSAPFTGYQIRYSRYSSMKKAKTITVSSPKSLNRKISKLSKRKKYYVQVRGYINSTSYYTSWSNKRSVKTR